MKKVMMLVLVVMVMSAAGAFAESQNYTIGATIPAIIGVNVFPESQTQLNTQKMSASKQELLVEQIFRNSEKVVMQTLVMK